VVPPQWRADLQDVLITEAQLRRRVRELARVLTREYVGRELLLVPLLTGTVMFLADLLRHLTLPLKLDFMGVSSYRQGSVSRELVVTKELRLEARDRHVLLVDDILDTGRTLACVQAKLRELSPRSLRTCVLLDKPARRVEPVQADYVGFTIPDVFVVGYGLDFAERNCTRRRRPGETCFAERWRPMFQPKLRNSKIGKAGK
jgi:hypoxanthine phosphoribosyltransferase